MIGLDDTIECLFQSRLISQYFVFGLGDISKQGYCSGFPTEVAFYMVGAWGLPASFGLGLAMANPERQIVVIDGDGSFLHSPGHLANLAYLGLRNYHLVIINNNILQSSGGQRIPALEKGLQIAGIIKSFGFSNVLEVRDVESLGLLNRQHNEPRFSIVRTATDDRRRSRVPLAVVRSSFQTLPDRRHARPRVQQ